MCFIRLPHLLVFACLGSVQATARDLHVGREVATIAQAIRLAQPGDTIHLEPRVYHEDAGFHARKGEPGRPITLDGHGATLDGSEPSIRRSGGSLSRGCGLPTTCCRR